MTNLSRATIKPNKDSLGPDTFFSIVPHSGRLARRIFFFFFFAHFLPPRSLARERLSKVPKIIRAENFSGLFSGVFLGSLKAPEFRPIFSGIFSGFVARAVARA